MTTTRNIMPCPVCRTQLMPTERQGIEIDSCPSCRGVWLDRGELDKIIERTAQSLAPQAPPTTGPWPGRWHDDDDRHHRPKKRKSFLSELFD
jgi:Zn-finger nucleic acid-binding protein